MEKGRLSRVIIDTEHSFWGGLEGAPRGYPGSSRPPQRWGCGGGGVPTPRGYPASPPRPTKYAKSIQMILMANSPGGGAGPQAPETFLFCAWFGRQSRPNQAQNQMHLGGLRPPNLPSE